jgi:ketosteroid isomerase-like protein
MEINRTDVVDEVRSAFAAYEASLMANDVEALDRFFWDDALVVRYGVGENLYGAEAIAAYRRSCSPPGPRELRATVITTFGRDFGVASTEYRSHDTAATGRQSQTWVRLADGWRIVAAHVSLQQPSEGAR